MVLPPDDPKATMNPPFLKEEEEWTEDCAFIPRDKVSAAVDPPEVFDSLAIQIFARFCYSIYLFS